MCKDFNNENEKVIRCCICERNITSEDKYCFKLSGEKFICSECIEEISFCKIVVEETIKRKFQQENYNEDYYTEDRDEQKEIVTFTFDKKAVYKEAIKSIKGRDDLIKSILSILKINLECTNPMLKTNILVIGGTGQGKTFIFDKLLSILGVPYYITSSTSYTEEGYVGASVTEMLKVLIEKANGDISVAERGVIVIDEFDKLRTKSDYGKDVSGEGVQNALLGMLSGEEIAIRDEYGNVEEIIDTKYITFILLGAFEGRCKEESLKYIRDERIKKGNDRLIGFSSKNIKQDEYLEKRYIAKDLEEYGMSRQDIGRIGMIFELQDFTYEEYLDILVSSKSSIENAYIEYFREHEIELVIPEYTNNEIVNHAIMLNTGARGLKEAFLEVIEPALEILDDESIKGKKRCIVFPKKGTKLNYKME